MKQIFEILQEERDRILNIHESATKNQYLNVILNEQEAYKIDKNALTLTLNNKVEVQNREVELIGGLTFKPTQKGNLGAYGEVEFTQSGQRKKTSIFYICPNKKLYVDQKYYDILGSDSSRVGFQSLCETLKKKRKGSYGVEQSPGKSVQGYTQANNYTLKSKDGQKTITIPAKTGYTSKKDKKGNAGATFKLGPTIFGWFGCKSKSFFIDKVIYKDEKNFLADAISKALCGASSSTQAPTDSPQVKQSSVTPKGTATSPSVKPTETALDAILQKISASGQKPADATQAQQTFEL
jgi:hypothetical protein